MWNIRVKFSDQEKCTDSSINLFCPSALSLNLLKYERIPLQLERQYFVIVVNVNKYDNSFLEIQYVQN